MQQHTLSEWARRRGIKDNQLRYAALKLKLDPVEIIADRRFFSESQIDQLMTIVVERPSLPVRVNATTDDLASLIQFGNGLLTGDLK